MKRPSLLVAMALLAAAMPALADPTPEHAASCVAALESEAAALAQQFRDGDTQIEPELVRRVQEGFAFIGAAYQQGLRGEEADRMLKDAEKAQESLPPAELAARQAACRGEGSQLLAHANVIERAFVNRAAQRRVDKLKRAS
jgi:plasmid stabilization system protein ParE